MGLNLVIELLIDGAEALHRVRSQLDRPTKLFELLCALEHRVLYGSTRLGGRILEACASVKRACAQREIGSGREGGNGEENSSG